MASDSEGVAALGDALAGALEPRVGSVVESALASALPAQLSQYHASMTPQVSEL